MAEAKKKRSLRETVELILLGIGFTIMIGSFLDPGQFRPIVAQAVDVIVSPITSSIPFYIVVLAIASIVTFFANFIQKYTMDWELIRRVNEKGRAFQKELREAQLAGDKKKIEKLQEQQLAMLDEQTAMSKQQLKPMGFLMIISVPLFFWAFWYLTGHPEIPPMHFPFLGTHRLTDGIFFFQYWIVWSFICSMAISQVIRKAFNVGISS